MWIRLACITAFPAVCAVRFYVGSIAENWVRNVESYGGLFYRVAGPLELIDPGPSPGKGPKLAERAKW